MFEKIFTTNSEIAQTNPLHLRRGVIIGLGQVGLACAYSLLIQIRSSSPRSLQPV